jgi:hypothetical protein
MSPSKHSERRGYDMKAMTIQEAMQALCVATGKPHMYVALQPERTIDSSIEDENKCVPYLDLCGKHCQILADEQGIIEFDSDAEMELAFRLSEMMGLMTAIDTMAPVEPLR